MRDRIVNLRIAFKSLLGTVKYRSVSAVAFGDWAVHESVICTKRGTKTIKDSWTVTHVPTGRCIDMYRSAMSRFHALSIARRLSEFVTDISAHDVER